jgi:WD40 repeat protein
MPRELPPPKVAVLTSVWSTSGSAAPGCFDFIGDGRHLFAAPIDSEQLLIYDVTDGKKLLDYDTKVGKIRACCPVGQDRALVTGDENDTTFVNALSGEQLRAFKSISIKAMPFSASPDGMDAICARDQGWEVDKFGLDTGMSIRSWTDANSSVSVVSVRYSPDGNRWVAVDEEGRIRIQSIKDDDLASPLDSANTDRVAILSASNKRMISFGKAAEIRIWDVNARSVLQTLPGHAGGVRDAVITPDDRWVFSVGSDKKLRIWDVATGKEDSSFDLPEIAASVRLSPKSDIVATASATGPSAAIQLWRVTPK